MRVGEFRRWWVVRRVVGRMYAFHTLRRVVEVGVPRWRPRCHGWCGLSAGRGGPRVGAGPEFQRCETRSRLLHNRLLPPPVSAPRVPAPPPHRRVEKGYTRRHTHVLRASAVPVLLFYNKYRAFRPFTLPPRAPRCITTTHYPFTDT